MGEADGPKLWNSGAKKLEPRRKPTPAGGLQRRSSPPTGVRLGALGPSVEHGAWVKQRFGAEWAGPPPTQVSGGQGD